MEQRKVTYKLYPNKTEKKALEKMKGVHQRLYNRALEQRIHRYETENISISFADQCLSLTQWRTADTELEEINAQASQVTLKRLSLAFEAFFKRVKNGQTPGFPRFKSYERYSGWGYKSHGDGWKLIVPANAKYPKIRLSGIGTLKMRGKSRFEGLPKTAEILHKAGLWFISITFNCEPKRQGGTKAIGLDWGVETFATYIDHQDTVTAINNPRLGKKLQTKIKQAHQALSRTQKGSNHRKQAVRTLGKHYQKLGNQRKDFIHKTSATIVKKCLLISTETLNVKNMTSSGGVYKKGLNREILNTTPAAFIKLLKYKAEEAGIYWVDVPTRSIKPSQTCYLCGVQVKKLLSQRWHSCPCGAECSRDENSARVNLNWALKGNCSQELAEAWRDNTVPMKRETPSIIFS